jgi:hypothetical protein
MSKIAFFHTSKGIISRKEIAFIEYERPSQEILIHLRISKKIALKGTEALEFLKLLQPFTVHTIAEND